MGMKRKDRVVRRKTVGSGSGASRCCVEFQTAEFHINIFSNKSSTVRVGAHCLFFFRRIKSSFLLKRALLYQTGLAQLKLEHWKLSKLSIRYVFVQTACWCSARKQNEPASWQSLENISHCELFLWNGHDEKRTDRPGSAAGSVKDSRNA